MNRPLPAPAKINLYLRITRIRPDGMHELDTAFAYTDLCDLLTITPADRLQTSCSQAHLSGDNNLVHKVLAAFQEKHGITQGLSVHIEKHIPEQAGLGGGSSDAATALMAANRLWGVHAGRTELIDFATPFGADIPCFLYGQASLAHGIGERMQDYPQTLPDRALLLTRPAGGLSTAEVFGHFDASHHSDRTLTAPEALDTIRRDSPQLADNKLADNELANNDLEASACALNPGLARLLQALRRYSGQVWMSGSGSACVALFEQQGEAISTAALLQQQQLASWSHVGRIVRAHPMLETL